MHSFVKSIYKYINRNMRYIVVLFSIFLTACGGGGGGGGANLGKTVVCDTVEKCQAVLLSENQHIHSFKNSRGEQKSQQQFLDEKPAMLYLDQMNDSEYLKTDQFGLNPKWITYDALFDYNPPTVTKSSTWHPQETAVGLDKISYRGRGVNLGLNEPGMIWGRNKDYASRFKTGMIACLYNGAYKWCDGYKPLAKFKDDASGKKIAYGAQKSDGDFHSRMTYDLMAGTEYGIAKKANLIPYAWRDKNMIDVYNHAKRNNVLAVNQSMGFVKESGMDEVTQFRTIWGGAFVDKVKDDANNDVENAPIWVRAAGNTSSAGNNSSDDPDLSAMAPKYIPEFERYTIAVVNIDIKPQSYDGFTPSADKDLSDGYELAFGSAQCAGAKRWCVAGVGEYAPYSDPDSWEGKIYTIKDGQGTSAAAPNITGGMAVIKEAFPSKSPVWIRKRLLATAHHVTADGKKIYQKYNDGGFKRREIKAVKDNSCISINGCSDQLGNGIMRLDLATKPIDAVKLPDPDSYKYSASKSGLAKNSAVISAPAFGDGIKLGLGQVNTKVFDSMSAEFDKPMSDFVRVQMIANQDKAYLTPVSLAKKQQTSPLFSAKSGMNLYQNTQVNTRIGLIGNTNMMPFTAPDSVVASYGLNNTTNLNMAFSPSTTDKKTIGKINMQYMTILSNTPDKKSAIAYGVNTEKSSIYGTRMSGQFKQNGHTNTAYISYHMQKNLNNWHMGINSTLGVSTISGLNGVMRGLQNVSVSEWGVQLRKSLSEKSIFGIGIRQPLKIETGDATLRYVDTVYDNDKLLHKDKTISIAPSGRAIILETMYRKNNTSVRMVYSNDTNHTENRQNHGIFMYHHIPFATRNKF